MKKTISLLIALLMVLTALSYALAENEPSAPITGELFKPWQNFESKSEEITGDKPEDGGHTIIFFDSLTSMLMALNAGRIETIVGLPECVADYIIARNDQYALPFMPFGGKTVIEMQIGLSEGNEALLAKFDDAIAALSDQGVLEALKVEYIDNLTADSEPVPVEMPFIEGAETVRVVVTGDLPPLDYVSSDGKPAGFNVALLAALSKEMGVNIELVLSDAGSRAAMLTSGRAEAVFWMRKTTMFDENGVVQTEQMESPTNIILTKPYIETLASGVTSK